MSEKIPFVWSLPIALYHYPQQMEEIPPAQPSPAASKQKRKLKLKIGPRVVICSS